MSMPVPPDDAIDADLQMRLGRNLLVFQRIEGNLKQLMSANQLSFQLPLDADTNATKAAQEADLARHRKHVEKRKKTNLGPLVGDYMDAVVAGKEPAVGPDRLDCITITFRYHQELHADSIKAKRERLAMVVSERNDLVHHFLERLSPFTPENLEAARVWLDAQHVQAFQLLQELRNERVALSKAWQAHTAYLQSPSFGSDFERNLLLQSPLVRAFADVAERTARDDGWAIYCNAVRIVREQLPGELDRLQDKYGHVKAFEALKAAGVFMFREESTPRGGHRLLYRLELPLP
jgi:hypothetical protein